MAHLLGLIGQNPNKLGSPGFADSHFTHQTGTIHLDGGVAVIDQAECAGCEICLQTCAEGAILSVSEPVAEKPGLPAAPPTPEVIQVRVPQPTTSPASGVTSMPWRARVLPMVGAATWAGSLCPASCRRCWTRLSDEPASPWCLAPLPVGSLPPEPGAEAAGDGGDEDACNTL